METRTMKPGTWIRVRFYDSPKEEEEKVGRIIADVRHPTSTSTILVYSRTGFTFIVYPEKDDITLVPDEEAMLYMLEQQ